MITFKEDHIHFFALINKKDNSFSCLETLNVRCLSVSSILSMFNRMILDSISQISFSYSELNKEDLDNTDPRIVLNDPGCIKEQIDFFKKHTINRISKFNFDLDSFSVIVPMKNPDCIMTFNDDYYKVSNDSDIPMDLDLWRSAFSHYIRTAVKV